MGFDELNLLVVEAVLCIELAVDVGNGLRPVDVGSRSKVLKRDKFPFLGRIILSNLQNSKESSNKLRLDIFHAVPRLILSTKASYSKE